MIGTIQDGNFRMHGDNNEFCEVSYDPRKRMISDNRAQAADWFVLGLVLGAVVAPMAHADVTGADVEKAIEAGIAYLRSCQAQDGSWPDSEGVTDLAAFALLTAGVPPDDPAAWPGRSGWYHATVPLRSTRRMDLHGRGAAAQGAADLNPYRPLIARVRPGW